MLSVRRAGDLSFRFQPMFEIVSVMELARLEEPIGTFLDFNKHVRVSFPVRQGFRRGLRCLILSPPDSRRSLVDLSGLLRLTMVLRFLLCDSGNSPMFPAVMVPPLLLGQDIPLGVSTINL